MTVRELMKILSGFDQDAVVMVPEYGAYDADMTEKVVVESRRWREHGITREGNVVEIRGDL